MTSYLHSFVNLFFIGLIALFPVVNPIGSAFMVNPYFSKLSRHERLRAVRLISLYAFGICAVTLFTGHWILELFGLSVPVIRLAGGIMICKIGWEFLTSDKSAEPVPDPANVPAKNEATLGNDKLFYPITFPLTVGAGTIAVLFTLTAHAEAKDWAQYVFNTSALLASVLAICFLIFISYANANRLIRIIGPQSEMIINRMMAFLIFCVGLQIAISGVAQLVKAMR